MASVTVYNIDGETVGEMNLSDSIFNVEINEHAVHMATVQYLANQRQGTKGTKTRSEVRGGGRKPWRQKGTGRARQGTIRAPHWRGGGVVFAPKSRDYSMALNKKQKRLALKSALSAKLRDKKLIVVENFALAETKTKLAQKALQNLNATNSLVVIEPADKRAVISLRNIPGTQSAGVNTINVYDILKRDVLLLTKDAVSKIEEVYV